MRRIAAGAAALALAAATGWAAPAAAEAPRLGPESNLPLPRFVSLNVEKANVRRGPGLGHRIDWVFLRRGAPLRIVAEHGHWRRVLDQDDVGGWVHHTLLRGDRTGVVLAAPETALRAEPDPAAPLRARVESGVIGALEACRPEWCLMEAGGVEGWLPKADIWGVGPDETFD